MKKICLIIVLVLIAVLLAGCDNEIIVNNQDVLITLTRHHNRPVQQTEYHRKTGVSVSYIYHYEECASCSENYIQDVTTVITDQHGKIMEDNSQ